MKSMYEEKEGKEWKSEEQIESEKRKGEIQENGLNETEAKEVKIITAVQKGNGRIEKHKPDEKQN